VHPTPRWNGAVVAVTHNRAFADALQPTYVARVEGGVMKTRMVTGGALSPRDFSPNAVATGGIAGAVKDAAADVGRGGSPAAAAAAAVNPEEAATAAAEAKATKVAQVKLLKEARNAPGRGVAYTLNSNYNLGPNPQPLNLNPST